MTAVAASLARYCVLCGSRRVVVQVVRARRIHGGGVVRCPHCNPEPGRSPLPIYLYPLRDDYPRGAA